MSGGGGGGGDKVTHQPIPSVLVFALAFVTA
jgi:hypothetical protein